MKKQMIEDFIKNLQSKEATSAAEFIMNTFIMPTENIISSSKTPRPTPENDSESKDKEI